MIWAVAMSSRGDATREKAKKELRVTPPVLFLDGYLPAHDPGRGQPAWPCILSAASAAYKKRNWPSHMGHSPLAWSQKCRAAPVSSLRA